jgi:anti-sigma factor RsiW
MSRGNEHDEIRERLALFVAGALAAGEEERIARHTATCPSCAAEIERWQLISGGLRQLRTPQPLAALFEGTRALAEAELAAQTERRRSRIVLTLLTVFSWTITIAGWPVFRLVTSGLLSLLDIRFRELWILFAIFSALTWVAGGSAAVLLSARRRHERRLA